MATTRKIEKNLLHIEADGCIVNIREGLQENSGRKVTHIEISCDDIAGSRWRIGGRTRKDMGIRVIQLKSKK